MQAVIIDNDTGYTKIGYAGNIEPDFIIPTAILDKKSTLGVSIKHDENDYYIGEQSINQAKTSKKYKLTYPIQDGIIESWDLMEKYWHQSIYGYLKCDPQEHYFVLTEPPMNHPENRENIAEIFFETLNVPELYIGVRAVFALLGYSKTHEDINAGEDGKMDKDQKAAVDSLTGVVVDSGDSATYIVPICDGFVVESNIKHFPIAGRKITKFMEQMIRKRGEKIPTEDLYFATMELKEKHG